MKIDWKAKLTSRKFWAAVVGFVTAILIAFGVGDLQLEQIIAIITAAATLIAYIIGEGMVDAASALSVTAVTSPPEGETRVEEALKAPTVGDAADSRCA